VIAAALYGDSQLFNAPEVVVGLLQGDDIHEAGGVGGVGPVLAVNLDQALHQDHLDLLAGQRIPVLTKKKGENMVVVG
jgi:hypothetical protein